MSKQILEEYGKGRKSIMSTMKSSLKQSLQLVMNHVPDVQNLATFRPYKPDFFRSYFVRIARFRLISSFLVYIFQIQYTVKMGQ